MLILCVYVENTAMASSIKMICSPVCACIYVEKAYWTNESIVGPSNEDKKWLYLHTCVCVCVYMWGAVSMGLLFSQVHTCVFLWSLATTCRVSVVDKRTLHASSLCVLCVMPSAVCRPCHW